MASQPIAFDEQGGCVSDLRVHPCMAAALIGGAHDGGAFLGDSTAHLRHTGSRRASAGAVREDMAEDDVAIVDQRETVRKHRFIFGREACDQIRANGDFRASGLQARHQIDRFGAASSWALILAAFAGAMASTGFILIVSRSIRHMAGLLVAGIMIGYICSAVTEFLVTFAEDSDIVNLHGWSQGSFSGADWSSTGTAALIVGIAFVCVFLLAKPIGAYQMGEAYAQSMGVNVRRFRMELILLSGILSACVTAFAGPVSFVGIAVPFLVKRALGTSKPLVVIPAVFLGGAVFCMFSDLVARMAFAPTELNISTVTSVFGAPIVIFMLIRKNGNRQ